GENFGEPIREICRAVRTLADRHSDLEVAYPVHLNPNIQGPVRELLSGHERIHLLEPLDYASLVHLMEDAYLILTDSGGLQEEAPVFGKPVLVLRRDTERPEAIEAGTALLVGTDEAAIVANAERLLEDEAAYRRMAQAQSPFGDGVAAKRIADILVAWARRDLASVAPVVFQLAAGKAVERCERDPAGAVRTNVLGSLFVFEAARAAGARRVVAASTDKACEPVGTLGVTKLLMERVLCEDGGSASGIAVRLGGIIESADSVLERWQAAARRSGTIEVTDPEMTRFLMSADEAVAALLDAAARDEESAIVAPSLPAYRLGDLADAFATAHEARVVTVGPRPGERTHESLVSAEEARFARREADG